MVFQVEVEQELEVHYNSNYFNVHQYQSYQDNEAESAPTLQFDHIQEKGVPCIIIILKNN